MRPYNSKHHRSDEVRRLKAVAPGSPCDHILPHFHGCPPDEPPPQRVPPNHIPCQKCGRRDLPLHTNHLCPECYKSAPQPPAVAPADCYDSCRLNDGK
jgi:hypothetical protein